MRREHERVLLEERRREVSEALTTIQRPVERVAGAAAVDVCGHEQGQQCADDQFGLVDGDRDRLDMDRVDGEEAAATHAAPGASTRFARR